MARMARMARVGGKDGNVPVADPTARNSVLLNEDDVEMPAGKLVAHFVACVASSWAQHPLPSCGHRDTPCSASLHQSWKGMLREGTPEAWSLNKPGSSSRGTCLISDAVRSSCDAEDSSGSMLHGCTAG